MEEQYRSERKKEDGFVRRQAGRNSTGYVKWKEVKQEKKREERIKKN